MWPPTICLDSKNLLRLNRQVSIARKRTVRFTAKDSADWTFSPTNKVERTANRHKPINWILSIRPLRRILLGLWMYSNWLSKLGAGVWILKEVMVELKRITFDYFDKVSTVEYLGRMNKNKQKIRNVTVFIEEYFFINKWKGKSYGPYKDMLMYLGLLRISPSLIVNMLKSFESWINYFLYIFWINYCKLFQWMQELHLSGFFACVWTFLNRLAIQIKGLRPAI